MEPSHFEALYPAASWEKEVGRVLGYIKQGHSCEVIGLPGTGRSNLLGLLSYNHSVREYHLGENQKWFHFVLTNFAEIRKRPLSDLTKYLFLSLVDSLRERNMKEEHARVNELFTESLQVSDELVLFQGLKKAIDYLSLEKELTVVFLFDRFEEYISQITPQFFTNLRVLRNRAKYRFSVVFSLHRPIEEMLEPQVYADFAEILEDHQVFLPLTDSVSLDFRISYFEKVSGKKITPATLSEIKKQTGGHGKLTRICIEALFAAEERTKDLSVFLLSQPRTRASLVEIWKGLSPSEQEVIEKEDFQNTPVHLLNIGLVKNGKITIPLLENYLKNNSAEVKTLTEGKIIYDADKNEIKRGETVMSDGLTSSEFKLLRFMIQNTDKILEREEIISSVWGDLATTEGVTDQALDQLIFRLRKKIEDNPNSPVHIQTVKGRGFRFTP